MKTRADHIKRLEAAERIYLHNIEMIENGVDDVLERLLADVRRRLAVLRRKEARDKARVRP